MRHVPTVAELHGMGRHLAYPVEFTAGARKNDPPKPTKWHVTEAGHALLGMVMRENALEAIASGAAEWTQPPSSGVPLGGS